MRTQLSVMLDTDKIVAYAEELVAKELTKELVKLLERLSADDY